MKSLSRVFIKIIDLLKKLLVPEDERISRLLQMKPDNLVRLLPKSPVLLTNIDILFDYRNKAVKLLIKSLKYKNNIDLKNIFAQSLLDRLLDMSSEITLFTGREPIIIPVPMSKKEQRERGFNQCEELLKQIKKKSPKNFDIRFNVLEKIRDTKRQAKLDKENRYNNIHLSMQVRDAAKQQVIDRVVIVVDDIYTTGATFREAKRALIAAEAKDCYGLFLAH